MDLVCRNKFTRDVHNVELVKGVTSPGAHGQSGAHYLSRRCGPSQLCSLHRMTLFGGWQRYEQVPWRAMKTIALNYDGRLSLSTWPCTADCTAGRGQIAHGDAISS